MSPQASPLWGCQDNWHIWVISNRRNPSLYWEHLAPQSAQLVFQLGTVRTRAQKQFCLNSKDIKTRGALIFICTMAKEKKHSANGLPLLEIKGKMALALHEAVRGSLARIQRAFKKRQIHREQNFKFNKWETSKLSLMQAPSERKVK